MFKEKRLIEFARDVIKEKDNTIKDLIRINDDAVRQLNQIIYEFRKYIESKSDKDAKDKR